jgi:hypothetical protein
VNGRFARRHRGETDPEFELVLGEGRLVDWNPELMAFACQVTVRMQVNVLDAETFEAQATFLGRFVSSVRFSRATARTFVSRQGLYLLWPFARPVFDGFARTAGVTVPMLPLFVVPGQTLPPTPAGQS